MNFAYIPLWQNLKRKILEEELINKKRYFLDR